MMMVILILGLPLIFTLNFNFYLIFNFSRSTAGVVPDRVLRHRWSLPEFQLVPGIWLLSDPIGVSIGQHEALGAAVIAERW